jgi:hypothetical protein
VSAVAHHFSSNRCIVNRLGMDRGRVGLNRDGIALGRPSRENPGRRHERILLIAEIRGGAIGEFVSGIIGDGAGSWSSFSRKSTAMPAHLLTSHRAAALLPQSPPS